MLISSMCINILSLNKRYFYKFYNALKLAWSIIQIFNLPHSTPLVMIVVLWPMGSHEIFLKNMQRACVLNHPPLL